MPILTQKWAILYLLHQLGDPVSETTDISGSHSPHDIGQKGRHDFRSERPSGSAQYDKDNQGSVPNNASFSARLKQLSTQSAALQNNSRVNERNGTGPDAPSSTPESSSAQGDPDPVQSKINAERPTEAALLRDLPFTLQGLSSTNLTFNSSTTLQLPSTLPIPLISLLHTLAEPSLLYRGLSEFVQSKEEGLIGQSLRSAIGSELRSYLGLIATLEGEIRRAITSLNDSETKVIIGKAGVTLKRCVVWTRDATMGLRLMSLMAEESKSTPLYAARLSNWLTDPR